MHGINISELITCLCTQGSIIIGSGFASLIYIHLVAAAYAGAIFRRVGSGSFFLLNLDLDVSV